MPLRRAPLALASVLALAACSSGNGQPLRVGKDAEDGKGGGSAGFEGSGSGRTGDGGIGSGSEGLRVRVQDVDDMVIDVITLACAGDCADVEAVARGGNAPYTFAWEDGSTRATRRVCLDASKTLSVSATDTAIDSEEFQYDAQTATADVTATVLGCADGGVVDADGGSQDSVYWATWTVMTKGAPGSAEGTLSPPGGDVGVTYSGEAIEPSAITGQPSTLLVGVATFTPESTYTTSAVTNPPPPSGMIAISGDAKLTQTITFSTPVRDPLIAVMSLGNFGMQSTWTFDAALDVLSTGPGIANQNGTLTASGNNLTGAEGNGLVQLAGVFTSLSFTVPTPEATALFTVGIHARE